MESIRFPVRLLNLMNLQRGDRKPVDPPDHCCFLVLFLPNGRNGANIVYFQAKPLGRERCFPAIWLFGLSIFFSGRLLLGRLLKAALVKCNRTEEATSGQAPKVAPGQL